MKNISKILLILCIILIISIFFIEKDENDEKNENESEKNDIRKKLEEKGLPTPAYGTLKQLKSILKNHSII